MLRLTTCMIAMAISFMFLQTGCGDSAAPKPPATAKATSPTPTPDPVSSTDNLSQGVGTTSDVCNKSSCPVVKFQILATSGDGTNGTLKGTVGQRTGWAIAIKNPTGKNRAMHVKLKDLPAGASSKSSGEVAAIDFTPGSAMSGEISVIVRDVSRCQAMAASSIDCADMTKTTDYDQSYPVPYSITKSSSSSGSSGSGGSGGSSGTSDVLGGLFKYFSGEQDLGTTAGQALGAMFGDDKIGNDLSTILSGLLSDS